MSGAAAAANRRPTVSILIAPIALLGVGASLAAAPGPRGMFGAALALAMLTIAVSDARRFVIPNPLIALALAIGIVNAAAIEGEPIIGSLVQAGVRAAVAAGCFFGLMIVYEWLRGRPGIGLGDIKLAAVAGIWLDWMTLAVAVELAAVAALAVYLSRAIVLRRPLRVTQAVPFGLYFAPAIWGGWLIEVLWLNP